jgi:PAS domain S-box-containing protein
MPILGSNIPYITFFPAVLLSAWFGGLGPGLTAVMLSSAAVLLVLIPPAFTVKPMSIVDVTGFLLMVAVGSLVTYLTSGWREKEKRLGESLERLRLAHRAARSGIWDLDLATGQLYWSEEMYDLYGFDQETQPTLENWLAVVHPEDRPLAQTNLTREIQERGVADFEFRILREGEMRWMLNMGQVTERTNGRAARVTGIARDITERKQAEDERKRIQEAQRESEERLRFAIAAARFGEWHLDVETQRIQGSARFFQILGCEVPPAEWTWEQLLERVAASERESLRKSFGISKATGSDWEFEAPITRDDDSSGWIWLKGGVVRERAGGTRYMAGLIADITDRRRAEEAVRESERIYRTIGEAIDYGIWICDADGRNTYASESFLKLVGMTQEECSALGWGTVLHPEDRERTTTAWKECVRTEGRWDVEHRYLGVDGTYHHILARGAPIRADDGHVLCWAGINLDITDLRRAERERIELLDSLVEKAEELQRSNRELEEFAYVASHDLQEPLRTIKVYTELLVRRSEASPSEEMTVYGGFVRSNVERMARLIRDLLAYSRTIHSDVAPVTAVPANAALDQAISVLTPLIEQTSTVISVERLPCVLADELQLAQVFQNILSNSIKYRKGNEPPRIQITSETNDSECVIHVRDNGIGFSPEYRSRIFGLFKRLHRDEYPGTGLGLAICKRILERYGGEIWADAAPNEGATFSFRLRLASRGDTAAAGVSES